MIDIKIIDEGRKKDINIPNEAFCLIGRMIPTYNDGQWDYRIHTFPESETEEMCFPDENYDYDEMKDSCVFIGAYEEDKCIGLAILRNDWFRYMYLYDLKVSKGYRRKGLASAMLQKAKEICQERNYSGIYTIAQDNNLSACLFYINTGFHIGALDTEVYKGTNQEGKADIKFYLDI